MGDVPAWLVQATAEAAPELVAEQVDRLRLVLAASPRLSKTDHASATAQPVQADEVRAA
ncbi:hypothetical protein ACGFIW_02090 [Micromonospora sp. NPDC048935]|uniref:hypothetical protein n=1 Tax=Micromonospora sp. NPDC048935 TaxID=3364262 RepID=UPI003719F4A9